MSVQFVCNGCFKTIEAHQVAIRGEADYFIELGGEDNEVIKPGEFDWCRSCLTIAWAAVWRAKS